MEIVENLEAALDQFRGMIESLGGKPKGWKLAIKPDQDAYLWPKDQAICLNAMMKILAIISVISFTSMCMILRQVKL